tara:strand:- start:5044 stop:5193 length:150 start_codon:yes stop_codon:yes gene_type:complete
MVSGMIFVSYNYSQKSDIRLYEEYFLVYIIDEYLLTIALFPNLSGGKFK